MAFELIVPTGEAGVYEIPALGRKVKLVEWKEDDYYDSVFQLAGAIAAGTQLEFFRDLANKNLQHTNLARSRNINAGDELVMSRIGLHVAQSVGVLISFGDDINMIAHTGSFTMKIGKTRIIAEGPVYKYQSGLGVTGSTTDTDRSYVTLGVPSAAAAPQLLVAQPVSDKDDLYGTLAFLNAAWVTGYTVPTLNQVSVITAFLHGLINSPKA